MYSYTSFGLQPTDFLCSFVQMIVSKLRFVLQSSNFKHSSEDKFELLENENSLLNSFLIMNKENVIK